MKATDFGHLRDGQSFVPHSSTLHLGASALSDKAGARRDTISERAQNDTSVNRTGLKDMEAIMRVDEGSNVASRMDVSQGLDLRTDDQSANDSEGDLQGDESIGGILDFMTSFEVSPRVLPA